MAFSHMAHQCRANDKRTIITRQRGEVVSQSAAYMTIATTRCPRKEKMYLFHADGSLA
jgi:hypothetical protein